jgi:hypothetical protein
MTDKFLGAGMAVLVGLLLLLPRTATAEPPSHYERETIRMVLRDMEKARRENPARAAEKPAALSREPQGKVIEGVDIVRLEVLDERDPLPGFFNVFHTTSKDYVIRREVLQQEGDRYREDLAYETARNLRRLPQLSLVVVVPLQGSTPDRVRLLVITKDVWSIRMGFNVAVSSKGLESFLIEPTESNVAGTQQALLGRFSYRPKTMSFGAGYRIPRLEGLRVAFAADANVLINNQKGSPEGSFGSVGVARPLFARATKWAWSSGVAWREEILRRYVGINVVNFNAKATPNVADLVPWQYGARRYTSTHSITRSYGIDSKNDFSFGVEMNLRRYRTAFDADLMPGEARPIFPQAVVDEFRRSVIPQSDTRVGPFAQWRAYSARFLRVHDFETLALQEDLRLGHDVVLRAYPVPRALGSSRDFVGVYAGAQYSVPLGDGLARASIESVNEMEPDRVADAAVEVDFRLTTPRFGIGRLIFDFGGLNRYRNYLNRRSFLGGDGRLRGFPSNVFDGKDVLTYNVEFRSRPVQILAVQLGGALFYDAGGAFDGFDNVRMHHSTGVGFRVLFPQVDRIVFRGDLGFPMDQRLPPGVSPVAFYFAFEQAFSLSTIGSSVVSGAPTTGGMLGQ